MPNHVTEFKSEIELLGILSSNQHRLKRFDVRFRLSGRSCSTAFPHAQGTLINLAD